jgi:mono/diheme cytochrome c family protein
VFIRMLLATTISIVAVSGIVTSAAEAKKHEAKETSEAIDGQQLFATTCGWCHANGGRTAGKGPKLAETKRSDAFITNRIKNGKEGAMPAFGGTFDDKQIKQIVAYIHSLKDASPQ